MKVLFIHRDMPGQFTHLAPALARQGHQVIFLTRSNDAALPGVRRITYTPQREAGAQTHHYVRQFENAVLLGQQAARACLALRAGGFVPDVVIAHPGWGEALFVKDVFGRSPVLNYCEFYYRGQGADIGFGPEFPDDLDTVCQARARNAHLLLSLELCDAGISPTRWQKEQHPPGLRDRISVIFDGVDTDVVKPDAEAEFLLPSGQVLTRQHEVVTYVARDLEPYRGFPSFMRAVPQILAARPAAHIVIAGGDGISYGRPPVGGGTWREVMLREVGPLDPNRVHFVGKLPYADYLRLLRVSRVHVYLTAPFVLSWSCMEALATGCVVLGSRTPPLAEVIEDGHNGLLADFFSPAEIAAKAVDVLRDPLAFRPLGDAARDTMRARYSLTECLPKQLDLINRLARA